MRQAKFGKLATGARLERIKKSPNFRDGKFQNLNVTPQLTEGYGYGQIFYEYFFDRNKRRVPGDVIPSVKVDLHALSSDEDILVWFGHSSYFIQLDGKRILVDPVFSGDASPIPGTNKAFKGTDRYTADDMPAIDYLFLTHDHYDHVDHSTLLKLKSKTSKMICGLGVGAHLEHWDFLMNRSLNATGMKKFSWTAALLFIQRPPGTSQDVGSHQTDRCGCRTYSNRQL